MKSGELSRILSIHADGLEATGATQLAAAVREFMEALNHAATQPITRFAPAARKLRFKDYRSKPQLGVLAPALESLSALIRELGKTSVANDLRIIVELVHKLSDVSISEFVSAIRRSGKFASNRNVNPGSASVDEELVKDYVARLEASLGDDAEFKAVFSELSEDKQIGRIEAIAIAIRFMGPTPASTSRPKALQRIMYRHEKLMDNKRASESIGGRSAA